jgi:drug/metabolite transporter (DMT)-like permease
MYKLSAFRKCNSALTTLSFMITVAILSVVAFFITHGKIENAWLILLFGILNSIFFLITTITRMEALKHIPTSVSYPIIRMGTIIVVIFSLIYFKDSLSYYQILGIILALVVIFILSKNEEKEKTKNFKLGIWLTIAALITSALTGITQKFASLHVDKLPYIAISYVINIFLSWALLTKLGGKTKITKKQKQQRTRDAWIIGFFAGLFNFFAFYSILTAYSMGPLAIAAPLHDMNFVIAIVLSAIFLKEKITTRRVIGVILSIVAAILLSLS